MFLTMLNILLHMNTRGHVTMTTRNAFRSQKKLNLVMLLARSDGLAFLTNIFAVSICKISITSTYQTSGASKAYYCDYSTAERKDV